MSSITETDKAFITGITPYFLERGNLWFEKNRERILEAAKTQAFFKDNTLFLEKDQSFNVSQFLRKLDEMGYEKVLQISDPGEFSQKGGLIEVFPVNTSNALRFEFLGNNIESISELPISIKNEKAAKEILKKKLKSQKLFSNLKGLKPGDYVVHLDHGIGKYTKQLEINESQYYELEYDKGDKLFIPFGLERKLSRYVGFIVPKPSRLGSYTWQRTKKRIKDESIKLAKELLAIYAKRQVGKRPPYLPDDEIDSQLADSFKYLETPDQTQAIEDIKRDLEKDIPMDRLVCGDVGFGKTEVALRTTMKAVKSGWQVAIICPTTILANQHFQNFRDRLKPFPVRIEQLSRLQLKKDQKSTVEDIQKGKVDIVIGTHRILSKDVDFKKLGLLIIDDEQRFGVKQKEKLKKLRAELDILSLSATPIPRTLYLSLSSLRSISIIQTPPLGRLPIKTLVMPWSKKAIKHAVEKEMERGGQIYYLHNRIETIEKVRFFLEKLFPKAVIEVAHGRLNEKDLISVMNAFRNGKSDILLATTIIENGLDLPKVNTLVVADAARLGLSQAYQIRGRIGRSHKQAFAYFLFGENLTDLARERLNALKEAKELGDGYKIALKDLEMRGAGNILGKEQSGSINSVGLNLYCQMLSDAVEKIKRGS
ncbi:DEAD/DEAH box helicase [Patescibacteria group bacterium]